jgi:hypothetical protein
LFWVVYQAPRGAAKLLMLASAGVPTRIGLRRDEPCVATFRPDPSDTDFRKNTAHKGSLSF